MKVKAGMKHHSDSVLGHQDQQSGETVTGLQQGGKEILTCPIRATIS